MPVKTNSETLVVSIVGAAIFSNFLTFKNELAKLETGKTIFFQLYNTYLIDHTVMEFLHEFQHHYEEQGGTCNFIGMEYHDVFSEHPLATRKMKSDHMHRRKSDHFGVN